MAATGSSPPRWRGRPLAGPEGASLVARLARAGLPELQRSLRYHRPRAPFCGIGQCTNCLVGVNGRPNVRGCRYVPLAGDRITSANSWPSPSWDLLGVLDLLFPRGLDTLHGFTWPRFAAPLYHRVIRRLAGYDRLPEGGAATGPAGPPAPAVADPVETDVLVIGAGDAGTAAAAACAGRGLETLLVDRGPPAEAPGPARLARTTVVFLPPPEGEPSRFSALVHEEAGPARLVRARRVVVATGGYDGPLLFGNGDRPGVVTAEGALALGLADADPWFRRAVVFGGGPRVLPLLDRFGTHVEAVVAPGAVSPAVVERASALDVPIYPRTLLLEALGRRRVRGLRLAPRGGGPTFDLEADALLLAHRRLPQPQLFYQAGARMRWHATLGAYVPDLEAGGATSVPGLYAAGTAAGLLEPAASAASGEAVADAISGSGVARPAPPALPESTGELEGYYVELLRRPRGRAKRLLCPCEDVLLTEVEEAVANGYRGVEVVKRRTGVGTGLCQGRYCLPDLLLVLAHLEGRPPAEVGYITQRPPVLPTPLGALARLPTATGSEEEGA